MRRNLFLLGVMVILGTGITERKVAAAPNTTLARMPVNVCRAVTYTVGPFESRETLSGIARRTYGRASWWPVIARANGIADPRKLRASTKARPVTLSLPCMSEAKEVMANLGDARAKTLNAVKAAAIPKSYPMAFPVQANQVKKAKPSALKFFARKATKVAKVRGYSTPRDNNPLNITYGTLTRKWVDDNYATVKHAKGLPFLAFTDIRTGLVAAAELLFGSPAYKDETLEGALRKWSNKAYGAEILRGMGLKRTTRVSALPVDLRIAVVKAMAVREGRVLPVDLALIDSPHFTNADSRASPSAPAD